MSRPRRALCLGVLLTLATGCASTAQGHPLEAIVAREGHQIQLLLPTCNADVDGTVDERPDRVVVTVSVSGWTRADCQDVLVVTVDEPVGDRPIVDGHSGDPVPTRTTRP